MISIRPITYGLDAIRSSFVMFAIGALLVAVTAETIWAQPRAVREGEVIKLAPVVVPDIYMATAVREDGEVVIQVSASEILLTRPDAEDKDAKGWIFAWTELDPLILGRQIRAYNPSGDTIEEEELLKALKDPVAVVCFRRMHKDDPEKPDPFYARVFRDDMVILVFEAKLWLR